MNALDYERRPLVIFGLGANQGEPILTLRKAVHRLLVELQSPTHHVAGMYLSAPLGPAQADYFNTALLVRSAEPPHALLKRVQQVESDFGRLRRERWGPRTLDIDVLWAGWVSNLPDLTVPHPQLRHRAFAVLPLVELREALPRRDQFPLPEGIYDEACMRERAAQRIERICGSEWATSD